MSARKPFRAVPISEGRVYRQRRLREVARKQRAFGVTWVVAAILVGTGVGYLSSSDESGNARAANFWSQPQSVPRAEENVYYRHCYDARAAGVAPISAGQPGYRRGLDRDADGVACEPFRR